MRCFLIVLFLAVLPFPGWSQDAVTLIEQIIKIPPRAIPKYLVKEKAGTCFLQTEFNNAIYRNPELLKAISEKVVVKVELIYTTYRKSETFDQHGLNRKRLNALFKAAPNLLSQPGIEWVMIGQTGCTSAEMGKEFFHGVVITTRETPTKALVTTEIAFLTAVADGKVPAHAYDAYLARELKPDSAATADKPAKKTPVVKLPEFYGGERARIDYFSRNLKFPATLEKGPTERVVVQFVVDREGEITHISFPGIVTPTPYHNEVLRFIRSMPEWRPGLVDNERINSMVTCTIDFMDRGSVVTGPLEIFAMDAPLPDSAPPFDYSRIKPTPQGKFVSETLEKNSWKNVAYVCDVTGSMAPYNAQVLVWLRNRFADKSTIARFVLFNDGDDRKDRSKQVGNTGGIYSFVPTDLDDIVGRLSDAMNAGSGGDLPENNVEALLKAEADCPSCVANVMIADNMATPRDMSIATKLTKPVHILVCGTTPVLNSAYLNLARMTKGSVHFNNRDYTNLHTLEEGGSVQVGKEIFVVKNGKFTEKR